jgi:SP family galactose:H+ symporter-like MFS transporter
VSLALFGAFVGALVAGPIRDRTESKSTISMSDVLFAAGAVFMSFSPSTRMPMGGRLIVGMTIRILSMVVPVYLSEIAPKEVRGTIVGIYIAVLCAG